MTLQKLTDLIESLYCQLLYLDSDLISMTAILKRFLILPITQVRINLIRDAINADTAQSKITALFLGIPLLTNLCDK